MTPAEHRSAQADFAAREDAERKRLIKLCNVARHDRGWDEEDWIAIKCEHGGASSLKDMDTHDLEQVLAYASRCGFKVTHGRADGGRSRPLSMDRQAKLLRGMWLELHGLGIVRDASEAALCSWASNSRAPNVTTDLSFLDGAGMDAAIERLKQWRTRELMAGEMYCPGCGRKFRPTPKQARCFPSLACDCRRHGTPYRWRKLPSGARAVTPNAQAHRPGSGGAEG